MLLLYLFGSSESAKSSLMADFRIFKGLEPLREGVSEVCTELGRYKFVQKILGFFVSCEYL